MLWCCHYCLWKMVLIWAREAIFAQMLTRATLVVEEPEHTDKTGLQQIRHAWTEKIILIWQLITWQKLNAKIGDLQHHRNQSKEHVSATATVIIETIRWRIHAVRASSGNGSCEQSEVFFLFVWEGGILLHFVIIHLNGLDCQSCQNICLYRVWPHTWSANHAIS